MELMIGQGSIQIDYLLQESVLVVIRSKSISNPKGDNHDTCKLNKLEC